MMAELRRDIGRLVLRTTAAVTGKILTADDQRRLAEETAQQLSIEPDGRAESMTMTEQTTSARGEAALPAVPRRGLLDDAPRPRRRARVIASGRRGGVASSRTSSASSGSTAQRHTARVASAAPLPDDSRRRRGRRRRTLRARHRHVIRRRSRADRRHAHQGGQRGLRRQRPGPAGRASRRACDRSGPSHGEVNQTWPIWYRKSKRRSRAPRPTSPGRASASSAKSATASPASKGWAT